MRGKPKIEKQNTWTGALNHIPTRVKKFIMEDKRKIVYKTVL